MIFSIFDSKPMLAYKAKILSSKVHIGKFHKVWPQRTLINVWMVTTFILVWWVAKGKETLKLWKIKRQLILALLQSFKFGCRYVKQIVLQLPLVNYRS